MQIEIFIQKTDWNLQTDIYIVLTDHNGKRMLAKPMPLVFEEVSQTERSEPSIRIDGAIGLQFLPALADALAKVGYKPETHDAGKIEAMTEHLKDMRRLVFEPTTERIILKEEHR